MVQERRHAGGAVADLIINKYNPPLRLGADGVRNALPVRATYFLSYLPYLPTYPPVKGPEILPQ